MLRCRRHLRDAGDPDMKLKLIATLAVSSLATLAVLAPPSHAAPTKSEKPKESSGKGAIPMPVFPGLKFGMSLEQIARLNDKDLDSEYKKKFIAAGPSGTLQVEDELRDKKQVLRRSRIDFQDTPTGIDQSALKGEYSYGNGESMARTSPRTRDDGKDIPARYYFFFNDKLWKIYEEYKLGPKSNLGTDFDSAIKKLTKHFGGVDPLKVPANYDKGQSFDEAVWHDSDKLIRAINRGDTLGVIFEEKSTHDNLAKLRTHQMVDQHALDKDVKAAIAAPAPPPGPPPKDGKTDKKGQKK
jgi:hypothetical protein